MMGLCIEKKSALKQAEIEAAELRGRLAAMEQLRQTPQPEVVDDPYAGIAPDTLLTPADLQRIEANRAAQQQKQAQQAAEAQRVADARESYTTALTATPDLTDVINAGEAYLTKGDKIDIFEGGKQAYQLAYQRCKLRLAEAGKLPTPTPAPLPATVAAKPEIKQPDPVPVPEQNMTPAKRLVSFLTE